jgi:hypothetical protein
MATENLNFSASVEDWVKAQKDRMRMVAQESTQRLVSVIQNTPFPVDTGFARASVRASLSEMPAIDMSARPKEGATYTYDPGTITAAIAGLQLGQTIHVGWTASYVQYLEYGHSKQAPNGMVRIGCAQWPSIVAEVSQEAKSLAA